MAYHRKWFCNLVILSKDFMKRLGRELELGEDLDWTLCVIKRQNWV